MTEDPDVIRRRIDETRAELSADVDAVGDAVDPRQVAHRQAEKVRGRVRSVRDAVMGSVHDGGHAVGSTAGDAAGAARSAAGAVAHGVQDAPGAVARQTQGAPLAAGLVAFGIGWLAASLVPTSTPEQRAAQAVRDKARAVAPQAKEAVQQVAADLREPAQEAAEAVKASASQAASRVAEHGTEAATDLRDQAQDAAHEVRQAPQGS